MVFYNVKPEPTVKQSSVFLSGVFTHLSAFIVRLFICAWLPLLKRLQDASVCGC